MEVNESKIGPKARTLDSLDAFDSDTGPMLMNRMHAKVGTQGQDFRCIRVIILGPLPEANDSNASKVGPKAKTFRFIRCISCILLIRGRGT